jgi:hypothetical protein
MADTSTTNNLSTNKGKLAYDLNLLLEKSDSIQIERSNLVTGSR